MNNTWSIADNWSLRSAAAEPPESEQPQRGSAKKRVRKVRLPLWELFESMPGPAAWYVPPPPAPSSAMSSAGASGVDDYTTPKKRSKSAEGSEAEEDAPSATGSPLAGDGPSAAGPSGNSSATLSASDVPDKPPARVSPAKLAALVKQARELHK